MLQGEGRSTELHDVVVCEHGCVTGVGRPVRRDVVQRAAGRERDARLEALRLDEVPHRVLEALAHVEQLDPRLCDARDVLPHLHHIASSTFGAICCMWSRCSGISCSRVDAGGQTAEHGVSRAVRRSRYWAPVQVDGAGEVHLMRLRGALLRCQTDAGSHGLMLWNNAVLTTELKPRWRAVSATSFRL